MPKKNIFCLEGLWETNLTSKSTVLPMLELLQANAGIKFIYRDCGTVEELEFYLKKWGQATYSAYPILYLAVCGYKSDVDWMISAAFELLVFSAMQDNEFSGRGIPAIQRRISEDWAFLAKQLEFRMVTRWE